MRRRPSAVPALRQRRDRGHVLSHHVSREHHARRGDHLSLSCNTDVTFDALDALADAGKPRPLMVCVVHPDLPYIGHDAEVPLEFADLIVDSPAHQLFALPREPVVVLEHAIGLHASTLVRDGGTLQIGIGALSDALVHSLLLREQDNTVYRQALRALRASDTTPDLVTRIGGEDTFQRGLYGASEISWDGKDLWQAIRNMPAATTAAAPTETSPLPPLYPR